MPHFLYQSLFKTSSHLALFILAALPGGAFAADMTARSKIDAVTVFPDAAVVTRIVEVDLPQGETTLVFNDLPAALDMDSLRARGEAQTRMTIASVEARLAPAAPPDGAVDAKLKDLRTQRETIAAGIEALDAKKAMIARFAQASPEKLAPDSAPLDIGRWTDAWEAVGRGFDKVAADLREARARLRDVDEQIRALEQTRVRPQPVGGPRRDILVAVETDAAAKARLVLTYRVAGASWRPIYDATLDTSSDRKASLQLVRRASISQRTGEDWTGVSLSVSTVRAARGAAPPDVHSQRLAFWEPAVVRPQSVGRAAETARPRQAPASGDLATAAAPAPPPPPMQEAQEQEASASATAYQAAFTVAGRIDARGDGTARSFRIGARTLPVDLTARMAPALDPTAYLVARIVNEDEAPLLAGEVSIHRNGMFIGKTRIGFVASGDNVDLAFGADDRIKVMRVPVNRKENEPTWFGQTKTETREFKTTVRNLHSFPMPIKIVDRVPISENTAIVIDLLPATTPPSEKIVEDRRGVMAWNATLAPNEAKDFRLAYRMKWPADRDVGFQIVPNGSTAMR